MVIKKRKGAALITVIIVMAVMVILGTSILNVSLAQTKEVAHEDKSLQAYYLARSGAEATLSAWENSSEANRPSGAANTVYLNSSNNFVDTSSNSIGKFDVTVTPPSNGNTDTVITSVGTVADVSRTVTITIKVTTNQILIPPISLADALLGSDLGWYDYTSGQIITGTHSKGPSGKVVKLEAKGLKGLKIPNKNTPSVTYEADKIVATSPIQVLHNSIIVVSNIIAFNAGVDFSANDGKGDITLKLPTPSGISIPGKPGYGVVYFGNVGYYFPDGVVLKSQNDINSKLIPIPSSDTTYYSNPWLSSTTQSVSAYSIVWS